MVTMSMPSRFECLKNAKKRYLKSTKDAKAKILDELCANTGYHRKYAIRKLSPKTDLSAPSGFKRKKRTSFTYTHGDMYWLAKVWGVLDYPCGQRLQPVLSETLDILISFRELKNIPDSTVKKLKRIKSSTIDDRLSPARQKLHRKIISTTKPGSLLKKHIPIRTSSWDESRVGCCELDTVAHCGNSAEGEFINSLNITDILTQWTETVALMGKAQKRIMGGLDEIKKRVPVAIVAIDPDNGSEFINWQLFRWCMERKIDFTRGRPYHKNDNAHIEQKNWTHVRKLIGYMRIDNPDAVPLMNDLYKNEWNLFYNFFIPSFKLIEKKRIKSKIVKKHDKPKTPYQRLLETDSEHIPDSTKESLTKLYETLDPFELRDAIEKKSAKILRLSTKVQLHSSNINYEATNQKIIPYE